MSKTDIKRMSTEELATRFEEVCIDQDDALIIGAIAKYTRLFREMSTIIEELKSRPSDQRTALIQFYNHPNRQVRIMAAIYTLALNYGAARGVLEEIKESQWFPQLLDAGMMLRGLDDGSYIPD